MARRFNKSKKSSVAVRKAPNATNLAGGRAYTQAEKLEFASIALTSFLKDQFYRTADDTMNRIRQLVGKIDPRFAAQTAVYARKVYGMRSVTHLIAAEIGHHVHGSDWGRHFFREVVQRPDDVTEILSAYMTLHSNDGIPNAMKKGLGEALSKFSAYQLGKYKGSENDMSLVDAINLLHPKHNKQLRELIKGKLKSPETWETKMSAAGQKAKSAEQLAKLKEKVWVDLLKEDGLGYFALLRNLRNISEQAPGALPEALKQLVNEKSIKSSLVLPFRFLSAYDALSGDKNERAIRSALDEALTLSMSNVPQLPGRTLIIVDGSGSMGGCIKKAALFAAVMYKAWKNSDIMMFETSAHYLTLNDRDSLTTVQQRILSSYGGGGTDFGCPINAANKKYDRMVFLSDMQGWAGADAGAPVGALREYKKRHDADPFIHSFDLEGYGTGMFTGNKLMCMAGISEKVFDIMGIVEKDPNALIHVIEQVKFDGTTNRFVDGVLASRSDLPYSDEDHEE